MDVIILYSLASVVLQPTGRVLGLIQILLPSEVRHVLQEPHAQAARWVCVLQVSRRFLVHVGHTDEPPPNAH